jgi:hypothetical protein
MRRSRRLASKGETISPSVVDVAERLCVVEHTDHKRFKSEASAPLFEEIRALYALNSGDTYRYSVSSAGAGGMVQMIPPTYKAIREQFPQRRAQGGLRRGHARPLERARSDAPLHAGHLGLPLEKQDEVAAALDSGHATQRSFSPPATTRTRAACPKYLSRGRRRLARAHTRRDQDVPAHLLLGRASVDFKNRS